MTISDEILRTDESEGVPAPPAVPVRRPKLLRRVMMRPRRVVVRVHRWLSVALLAWLIVIGLTGAFLAEGKWIDSVLHGGRYEHDAGDVGPDAVKASILAAAPEGSTVDYMTLPLNGRGVYQAYVTEPGTGTPAPAADGEEPAAPTISRHYYVDPSDGHVNARVDDEAGLFQWMYRGHMYLWQDHGIANADSPNGWCHDDPGGIRGVACTLVPSADDGIAWMAVAWIVVLLTGFYLWYWPGIRRWATALRVRRSRGRFTFHLDLHKSIGVVVWVPLVVVAFTGAAFAFPNMKSWYENVTPAERGGEIWEEPEGTVSTPPAAGAEALTLVQLESVIHDRYPDREIQAIASLAPEETDTYSAWLTRGYDPWSREGGAGNVYTVFDRYTGATLYDGTPEELSIAGQVWSDWSYPMHTGDFLGRPGRMIWVLLGLSPLVLAVTGVTMNLVRRSKRRARAATSAVEATPVG